jgi:hypothetical protein
MFLSIYVRCTISDSGVKVVIYPFGKLAGSNRDVLRRVHDYFNGKEN